MNATALLRADLRDFAGYRSAGREAVPGDIRLNANEAPRPNAIDALDRLRRYPPAQPPALCEALAQLYGCATDQLLVARGSDEAVDLLVRATCAPGQDAVLVTPPTFGMYAVCARLHGAKVIEAPLQDQSDRWALDAQAVIDAAVATDAKLVFLCSPANPTGQALPLADIAAIARRLQGRAMVIVDEAYGEFSNPPSAVPLIETLSNVAVLRTLSKAHALAGARIGTLIADANLIAVLRNCQAPYPLPAPCVRLALQALQPDVLLQTRNRVIETIAERERLYRALRTSSAVRHVYPSQGNFLLVRFTNADAALQDLLNAGIVVRDVRKQPQLGDALRISIGSPAENDALLAALSAQKVAA